MYRCVACGKTFRLGAYIIPPNKVYCPDCAEKLEEIIQTFEIDYMKSKMYGKKIPDIDEYIKKRSKEIRELNIHERWVMYHILRRCTISDRERA